jgi:hypothetical protein
MKDDAFSQTSLDFLPYFSDSQKYSRHPGQHALNFEKFKAMVAQ